MNQQIAVLQHRFILWLACCSFSALSCANLSAQTSVTQRIASTGSAAPGVSGGNFNFPGTPTINNAGEVAFYSSLQIGGTVTSANSIGIWGPDSNGNLSLIARVGSSSGPAVPGALFATLFESVKLNDAGRLAIAGTMQAGVGGVTTANQGGIWTTDSLGVLGLEMRTGSGGVPGVPGANFSGVNAPLFNNSDQLLFINTLQTGIAGVTTSNNTGVWAPNTAGDLSLVMRYNAGGVPGIAGASYNTLFSAVLSDSGKTAFAARLVTGLGGVTASDNIGVWGPNAAGALTLLARTGSGNVPGVAGASFSSMSGTALNSSGRVAFYGELTGVATGTRGIWRQDSSGNLGLFVRSDSGNVPGVPATSFNSIVSSSLRLNDAGHIAFVSTITNNRYGLWATNYQGNLTLVAGAGVIDVPNAPGVSFNQISRAAMNGLGTVAFDATLTGSITAANNSGIFIGDGIELIKVVRKGDTVFGSSPVTSYSFNDQSSGNDGRETGLNDFGQIAYNAGTSPASAVILWTPDLHWRGTANDGNWNSRANFTLSLVPGKVHRVFLDPASDLTISGPLADTTVKELQIGSAPGAANLQLADAVTLTVSNLLDIRPNGKISGTGRLVSSFTLQSGATLSPGTAATTISANASLDTQAALEVSSNSTVAAATGTLEFVGNQTWGTSGVMELQIGNATGTSGSATGWDLLSIDGSLTITATSSQKFILDVETVFGNLPNAAQNFDPYQSYAWTFATATGGITGFDADDFSINLDDFANPYTGTFSVSRDGNSLNLIYTAIPEPSSWAIAFLGIVGWIAASVRHSRTSVGPAVPGKERIF